MLNLRALHLRDFGPFKGKQTVTFSAKDGVTVIYGENMRGKTSLLNAIRFAFFGKVIGRGMKATSLHKLGNWEQAANGGYGFEVQLDFEYDEQQYSLTRSCKPRPGTQTPSCDEDYVVEYFVRCDGKVLGPQQAEAELRRILPEQIARFFLFDGELLQEYEDLLSNESDMGRRISEAIERILGVPVLTSTRSTLLNLKEKSQRREATAAQGDQKTREFGNQLANLHEQRQVLQGDLARLEQELNNLRSKKAGLEESMKKKERIAALLDRRDNLLTQITGLEQRRASKSIELQNSMADAWAVLLSQPIRSSIEALRTKEAELQTAILRQELLKELGKKPGAECPACLQEISPAVRKRIEASLEKSGKSSSSSQERELGLVRRRLTALLNRREEGKGSVLELQWKNVDEIEIDIASKKSEVEDIRRQLQDIDEEGLRKTKAEFEMVVRQMDPVERGITDTRSKLVENVGLAENIQKKLDKLAGANLAGERRRREAFTKLHALMDSAVAAYRDELRKRVQADATRHLKALTTEPEYSALRINDSYGLTIVHKDGTDIPVRSAGAEHIVALCLMGALQNNAPLRGPIVIDSPFGRLDRGHTRNVVRALPNMAKQVVLLVYEDELPPDLAREELLTSLRGEWKLERRTARHTELVPRKD